MACDGFMAVSQISRHCSKTKHYHDETRANTHLGQTSFFTV